MTSCRSRSPSKQTIAMYICVAIFNKSYLHLYLATLGRFFEVKVHDVDTALKVFTWNRWWRDMTHFPKQNQKCIYNITFTWLVFRRPTHLFNVMSFLCCTYFLAFGATCTHSPKCCNRCRFSIFTLPQGLHPNNVFRTRTRFVSERLPEQNKCSSFIVLFHIHKEGSHQTINSNY